MPVPSIDYANLFRPIPYIDNLSRVSAGGQEGFNARFQTLEAELDKISKTFVDVNTAVTSLNSAITGLGAKVSAPVTVALPPVVLPYKPATPWSPTTWGVTTGPRQGTFVQLQASAAQTEAWGVVPLTLPDGVSLISLSVSGSSTSGTTTTDLIQELHAPPFAQTSLVTVPGFAGPIDIPNHPVYASGTNLYYLLTRITGVNQGDVALLRGFQITYQPA